MLISVFDFCVERHSTDGKDVSPHFEKLKRWVGALPGCQTSGMSSSGLPTQDA